MYRRSLSSGPNPRKAEAFQNRDPQGLRRPRFSFFFFTCQTARDPKISHSLQIESRTPIDDEERLQPTTIGCCVTQRSEERQRRQFLPRLRAKREKPDPRAACGCFYSPPLPGPQAENEGFAKFKIRPVETPEIKRLFRVFRKAGIGNSAPFAGLVRKKVAGGPSIFPFSEETRPPSEGS